MSARYRLAAAADREVEAILQASKRRFGRSQRVRCAAILRLAVEQGADQPSRTGSKKRADLGAGVRSFTSSGPPPGVVPQPTASTTSSRHLRS